MTADDHDLRELFARARREDRERTPSFDAVVSHARARVARPRWGFRALAVAAAAAGVVVLARALVQQPTSVPTSAHDSSRPDPQALTSTVWTFPTDFLLNTPGSGLLREVPTFGAARWIGASADTSTRNRS